MSLSICAELMMPGYYRIFGDFSMYMVPVFLEKWYDISLRVGI